ncbi:ATP-binding protein [Vibrio sp. SS-MA-C1-2]|uniref:ATP-binding protein n=1 Tax=Vibrio sp. SS-MA-C1-2 TaxID=2908646 RepID=UPI001F307598|nr:ATP-binding protein [Vibrio sp. SS-MA-C1-2]UJF20023.1 ATP-binding protein [Vibrio sp. SS-MA-C1-2]
MSEIDNTPSPKALMRKIARESGARKQAEQLLEQKSRELFDSNKQLELAIQQLEKSSAENLIKLDFQQNIDKLLIYFGRVFLNTNIDDHLLTRFISRLQENRLITGAKLTVNPNLGLELHHRFYGGEKFHTPSISQLNPQWQDGELFLPLIINDEQIGTLTVEVSTEFIEAEFVEGSLKLVSDILSSALNRQHVIYRNIESRKMAEKSERSTRDFLAMINHELRTPLNGLLGSSELLKESPLNSEQQLLLNNISQSGELLRAIINDLLDYSKINSGVFELIMGNFKLNALLQTIDSIFQSKAKEKGIQLIIINHCPQAMILQGDLERLTQIMVNLIGNAVKFTDKGSVTISLSWESERLNFAVKDTGIGISKEAQTKLFRPFTQVDRSSSRNYEGTGLGLAICLQLVQLMEGEISLTSKVDQGSEFFGSIPIKKGVLEETDLQIANPLQPITFEHLSLLVVEDVKMNQIVIKRMLGKLGITPDLAINGVEAISYCENNTYDLILMDCRMPEMDGFEATSTLRSQDFSKPIIALTAGTTLPEREQCIESGMDDILTKPYNIEDLRAMLTKWGSTHQ